MYDPGKVFGLRIMYLTMKSKRIKHYLTDHILGHCFLKKKKIKQRNDLTIFLTVLVLPLMIYCAIF